MTTRPATTGLALRSVRARGMATEGIIIKDATKADTGVASIAKEELAASKSSSKSSSSSSGSGGGGASFLWQRFTAFMTGVGVASALLYVRVQEDIWASSAAVQESVAATKADTAEINRSLRERIARHYAEAYGVSVDPGQVAVTTGSSGGFVLSFIALFASVNAWMPTFLTRVHGMPASAA